ncbi:MAG: hypothetical protein K2I10_11735 [Lachnospiraceae bacterium]|nr:hypothetical protein [Lachnospiraceae bacterium]
MFIQNDIQKIISQNCDTEFVTPEQLEIILTQAFETILTSRDFSRLFRKELKEAQR